MPAVPQSKWSTFDCLESLEKRELLNKVHVRLFVARQTCIRNTNVSVNEWLFELSYVHET